MAKSDEARGPVALWMRRERLVRGWTTHDVVRELAKRGHAITEPSYRGYEAGPRVSAPIRKALEAVFGSKAPDTTKETAEPPELDSLIGALVAQTAAVNRLAEAIAMNAGLPDQIVQSFEARLEQLGLLPAEGQDEESQEHPADAEAEPPQSEKRASTG